MIDPETAVQLLTNRNLAEWYSAEPERLPDIQEAIISSAALAKGYAHITWQACNQLISATSELDVLLRKCILPAIARALDSAMGNGEWYRALGFINLPWPNDMVLRDLLDSRDLRRIFASCAESPSSWQLPPDTCRSLPADIQHQVVAFLPYASQLGFPLSVRHQLSASLLIALDPSSDDFVLASGVLLDGLVEAGMSGLAFIMWRSLADVSSGVAAESRYLLYVRDYVEKGWESGIESLNLIVSLASDELLLQMCETSVDFCIGLCALVFHGVQLGGDGALRSALFRLLQHFGTIAPNLTEAIRIRLATHRNERESTTKDDAALFERTIETLRWQFDRKRTYRGLPLAQEIWRYNLVKLFTPILEHLCAVDASSTWLEEAVERLDARKIVVDCPPQKESIHPIEGEVLANLIRDTEEITELVHRAHDILSRNPEAAESFRGRGDPDQGFDIELDRLGGTGALSAWAVERFLKKHFCIDGRT